MAIQQDKINILLLCRRNCKYSKKIIIFLKKNKKVELKVFYSEIKNSNILIRKINKINEHLNYIICFRSYLILKTKQLKKTDYVINFHPGTPEWRGIGCTNYAIFHGASTYGSTCHFVNKKIDNGKIINVKRFKINKKIINIESLLEKTYQVMFQQCIEILRKILKNKIKSLQLINFRWSKKLYYRRDLENLYRIPRNCKKKDFDKILRATLYKNFVPYIEIYDNKFFYKRNNS